MPTHSDRLQLTTQIRGSICKRVAKTCNRVRGEKLGVLCATDVQYWNLVHLCVKTFTWDCGKKRKTQGGKPMKRNKNKKETNMRKFIQSRLNVGEYTVHANHFENRTIAVFIGILMLY